MPTPTTQYRVKDLTELTDPTQLLGKSLEVESNTADENFRAGLPLLIRTVGANLPAPTKATHLSARTYDTTDPNYIPGDATLVSESLRCQLVMWMTAFVEFPKHTTYQLQYDPAGQYQAFKDTQFFGQKLGGTWVDISSAQAGLAGIVAYSPFATYAKDANVKYELNGQYRLFAAAQPLSPAAFSGNQVPAPTGLAGDPNWVELNADEAPNYSRVGQIACRFFSNAERAADPYPYGDTLEDVSLREALAGAGVLYLGRTATVELGPNAGPYQVGFDPANRQFMAHADGSFTGGLVPAAWERVAFSDVTRAYVDAADASLQGQVTANVQAIGTNAQNIAANAQAIATEKGRMDTLVAGAPQALDTLKEISDQLAADEQGTAAILATQQQHTQQLVGVAHLAQDETFTGSKTFTAPVAAASYRLGAADILVPASTGTGPGYTLGNAAWDGATTIHGGHDTTLNTGFFTIIGKGTGSRFAVDNQANVYAGGTITAPRFVGDGSQLTNLPTQASVLYSATGQNTDGALTQKAASDAIATNSANIATNSANIATNSANIATNVTEIGKRRYAFVNAVNTNILGSSSFNVTAAMFGTEQTFSITNLVAFNLPAPGTVPAGAVIKIVITASPNGVSTVRYTPSGASSATTLAQLQFNGDYAVVAATSTGYVVEAASYVPTSAQAIYGVVQLGSSDTYLTDAVSSENYKYVSTYMLGQRVKYLLSQRQTWAQAQTFTGGVALGAASTSTGTLTFSGGAKVTGLPDGTVATDAATYNQVTQRLTFAGTYVSGSTSVANSLVLYNNVLWQFKNSGSAQPPSASNANRLTPVTFTPSAVKSAVTGGSFSSGELQGTQPTGSLVLMRFTDATYHYEYTYAAADTDGTQLAWVRTAKA